MADTLGQTLKLLREEQQLTLKEAAGKLAIDLSLLARIEKGQRSVNDALLTRLAALFGVSERQLRTLALADNVYQQVYLHDCAAEALQLVQTRLNKQTE
jgi:transcriptional regulator with XRE-family HTH domain